MMLRRHLSLLPLLLLCYHAIPEAYSYSYVRGPVPSSPEGRWPCPGDYCGRMPINSTMLGECGRCERGWRVHDNVRSECRLCADSPGLYDWLFLAFHALSVLVLHWTAVDVATRRRSLTPEVLALHACALAEVSAAAIFTLLLYDPVGSLSLRSCAVRRLSDWYSFLHNPTPNYEETLYCTQEVVYPLYTMVFTFYALCALLMLLVRPCLSSRFGPRRRGRSSVYAALYFLPALSVAHACLGGLVYMSYPHIVLVLSLISCAAHFAYKLDQSARALLLGCVKDSRNLVILIGLSINALYLNMK